MITPRVEDPSEIVDPDDYVAFLAEDPGYDTFMLAEMQGLDLSDYYRDAQE